MKLRVLGTVSPHCTEEKNCPGFLITTKNDRILLDCGNGITRNLIFPEELQDLTIIISHLHRDHYGDLLSIAYTTYVYHNLGLLPSPIKIYIPESEDLTIEDYNLLTNLGEEQYFNIYTYDEFTTISTKDTTISFSKNPHNIKSYSIKVTENNNSIVYSGDTGYIGNTLETFAVGTNLLICESTFIKGQKRKKDYHLYAHEAATIANVSKVKQLLLTHFWPTIDKEEYLKEATPIFKNTQVAEENQVLSLK